MKREPNPKANTSIFSMQHVNSQNSVREWRSAGALSEGASEALVRRLRQTCPCSAPRMKILEDRSFVCSLVEDLMWAVQELNTKTGSNSNSNSNSHTETGDLMVAAEGWAIFLHGILTHEMRAYHGIAHVFKICAGASPIQLLAAFFRDTVSHYIDGMVLDPRQEELLEHVFEPGTLILSNDLNDARDCSIVEIFGYELGMELSEYKDTHKGLDIFLSALLASRLLGDALELPSVVQLAVCLEVTIPFRNVCAENGQTPLDVVYARLEACNAKYQLNFTKDQMIETVQQAADLYNRCVGNMVSKQPAEFLDHTWRLLPEKHAPLRQHALYTLTDYYKAIKSMVHMTDSLQPDRVCLCFHHLPNEKEMQRFRDRLSRNLIIAREYLRARLLSVAVVSALACLTGGDDAPKTFFFGDLPAFHKETTRLGDQLIVDVDSPNNERGNNNDDDDDQVYLLLATGEGMSETSFDTHNAPLAAFLHRELGPQAVADALAQCEVPMTEESARSLLVDNLPPAIVQQVGHELGRVAVSRQRWIDRFLVEL